MNDRYRLGVITTHPIQYHASWFRGMAAHPNLDIHVYYCHKATPLDQARAGFGVEFDWDVPLLTGYEHSFLRNVANPPGHGRFAGFDSPEIKDIIGRREFDAVLVNGWHYKSAWQAIWACWRSNIKVMVRGDSHLHSPRSLPVRLGKALAYPRFISRFDACLAVGQWSREYFLHYGVSPERLFLVPHTVDVAWMAAHSGGSQTIRSELRKRWELSEGSIVFVFVGKFTDIKRPMDFVRAVCEASKRTAAVQGLMVGDGPLRNVCEDFVRIRGVPVTFAGFLNQSQIVDAYIAADVLVLPSAGETWGIVVNEAMACKRPCIVSDTVGCWPDLIRTEETGAVFPQGDVDALAALMIEFAGQSLRLAAMGIHARERVEKYSVQTAVEGVLKSLVAITDSRALHAIAD